MDTDRASRLMAQFGRHVHIVGNGNGYWDIKAYFDTIDHDLLMKAVRRHTDEMWVSCV